MWLSIVIFLVSIIPSVLIAVWMTRRHKEDVLYKKTCKKSFLWGVLDVLPILLVSGTLYIINKVLKLTLFKGIPILAYQAVYTFVVLAFAEEIIKYVTLRLILKKKTKRQEPYSWSDVVAFMVVIGTAFGLIEDIPYAVGANVPTMLIRGFTMGHVGYGFMMGWFYGKACKRAKNGTTSSPSCFPGCCMGSMTSPSRPNCWKSTKTLCLSRFSWRWSTSCC